jgi:ribose transport system substrate-binding protein
MKKFLVSLHVDENDYQRAQAASAKETAQRLGVEVQVVYAENDAVNQSQQLLTQIQSSTEKPAGIICQPVGTDLVRVATASAQAGIPWAVVNRSVDYISELWSKYKVPVMAVTVDQEQAGRIQGKQIAALLPEGGTILYIQGPNTNPVVKARTQGMLATKPATVLVRTLSGNWGEQSGYQCVKSWLRLATSAQTEIALVVAQNDDMAMGARRAFETVMGPEGQWPSSLFFTGCDAGKGREWVKAGLLAASVSIPPTAGLALENLVKHIHSGTQPPERILIEPKSFPALEQLKPAGRKEAQGSATSPQH